MTLELLITAIAVAAGVGLTVLLILRYPPELVRRTLTCPLKDVLARVAFRRRETRWGRMTPVDVAECSLFPDGRVDCDRKCMGA